MNQSTFMLWTRYKDSNISSSKLWLWCVKYCIE